MTKDELFAEIQKSGLVPVPVILQDTDEDGCSIAFFDGDLHQFLASAKAIGSGAVFVQENPLQEEDFDYIPDEDEDDEAAEDADIDLSTVSTALAKFKKYLGQTYSFCLVAKGGVDDLRLIVDQDWVEDFENERERAEGKILVQRSKARNN